MIARSLAWRTANLCFRFTQSKSPSTKTYSRSIHPHLLRNFSTQTSRQLSHDRIHTSQPYDAESAKGIIFNDASAGEITGVVQSESTSTVPSYAENPNWILPIPETRRRQLTSKRTGQKIKVLAPSRSAKRHCPEPLKAVNASEIAKLDPTGARTRLFALDNPDAIQVRDIVLVRQKTGDPFAGVVLRIKRAGPNSGILLRNTVVGTGVEMDFKIYSPSVTGIEVVQRRPRKPKQHRLYYLRDPKHDVGSVDNVVRQYLRSKMTVSGGKTVLQAGARPQTKAQKKRR